MRIRRFYVERFGIHSGLLMDWTQPGADVRSREEGRYGEERGPVAGTGDGAVGGPILISGPNEAGKSTLLAFLRFMLFGFAPRTGEAARYEPAGGGGCAGWMDVSGPDGREYRIERQGGIAGAKRSLRLIREDGRQGGEDWLADLTGGMDADLYRNIFAFGLRELQEIATLQGAQISSYLYGAGLGVDGGKLLAAEQSLRQEMEQLFLPRGSKREMNALLRDLGEVERQLRQSRDQLADYERAAEVLQALRERVSQREEALAEARGKAEWLQQALKCWDDYVELTQSRTELEALPVFEAFPEQALERLERVTGEIRRQEAGLRNLEGKLEELSGQERSLASRLPDNWERLAATTGELLGELPAYREAVRNAARLADERVRLEEECRRLLRLLDKDWDEAAFRAFPTSVAHREQVREWQHRLERADRELWGLREESRRLAERREAAANEAGEAEQARRRAHAALLRDVPFAADWRAEDGENAREAVLNDVQAVRERAARHRLAVERLANAREQYVETEQWMRRQEERERHWLAERRQSGSGTVLQTAGLAGLAALAVFLLARGKLGDGFAAGTGAALGAALWLALSSGWRRERKARKQEGIRLRDESEISSAPARLAGEVRAAEQRAAAARSALQDKLRQAAARINGMLSGSEALPEYLGEGAIPVFEGAEGVEEARRGADEWAAAGSVGGSDDAAAAAAASFEAAAAAALERLKAAAGLLTQAERAAERLRLKREQLEAAEAACREQAQAVQAHARDAGEIRQGWQDWLAAAGLPDALSPAAVLDLFPLADRLWELFEQRAKLEEDGKAAAEEMAEMERRCREVFGVDAPDWPSYLLARDAENREFVRISGQAARLREAQAELAESCAAGRELLNQAVREREDLLRAAGAQKEEDYRRRAEQYERSVKLRERIERSLSVLDTWTGRRWADMEAYLDGNTEERLQALQADNLDELQALDREIHSLREQIGAGSKDLESLTADTSRADLMFRRGELEAGLLRLAGRWAEAAIGHRLLKEARESFERERQPALLRRASEYFGKMTGGRYRQVSVRIGEQTLYVQREDGRVLDSARLSAGTAEQLYLSMRLALADRYAERHPLPLMMDDILVNFDDARLKAGIAVIGEAARRHQVMLFTCHPHIGQAMRTRLPNLQEASLHRDA